jgi:hypothetical protein
MPTFASSAIARAEYDAATAVLSLWFVESGGPYDYFLVPGRIYDELCRASSAGTYYNRHIRDRYTSRPRLEAR